MTKKIEAYVCPLCGESEGTESVVCSHGFHARQSYTFELKFMAPAHMPREQFIEKVMRKALAMEQLANEDMTVRCHISSLEE